MNRKQVDNSDHFVVTLVDVEHNQIHRIEASDHETILGRSAQANIKLQFDNSINQKHAQIVFVDGLFYVRNLSEAANTTVNFKPVWKTTRLNQFDLLKIGSHAFRVELHCEQQTLQQKGFKNLAAKFMEAMKTISYSLRKLPLWTLQVNS